MFVVNEKKMLSVGFHLAKICPMPFVIYLQGSLGAGKTTFARGFLAGLGYQGKVKSPTYTLVEIYELESKTLLYHFDFYRIQDPEEIELMGIRDYFQDQSISLIEWPELAFNKIPKPDLICDFNILDKGRQLSFLANSLAGERVCLSLSHFL